MEAMLFVYFANMLPQFSGVIKLFTFFLTLSTAIWLFIGAGICCNWGTPFDDDFNWKLYKKVNYYLLTPLIILSLIRPLIPDRDTMYLMAGAYVGQQVLTSDIAKDAYEIIGLEVNKILQEKKKELQSKIESTTKEVTQ